jgi:hypothetical protein
VCLSGAPFSNAHTVLEGERLAQAAPVAYVVNGKEFIVNAFGGPTANSRPTPSATPLSPFHCPEWRRWVVNPGHPNTAGHSHHLLPIVMVICSQNSVHKVLPKRR